MEFRSWRTRYSARRLATLAVFGQCCVNPVSTLRLLSGSVRRPSSSGCFFGSARRGTKPQSCACLSHAWQDCAWKRHMRQCAEGQAAKEEERSERKALKRGTRLRSTALCWRSMGQAWAWTMADGVTWQQPWEDPYLMLTLSTWGPSSSSTCFTQVSVRPHPSSSKMKLYGSLGLDKNTGRDSQLLRSTALPPMIHHAGTRQGSKPEIRRNHPLYLCRGGCSDLQRCFNVPPLPLQTGIPEHVRQTELIPRSHSCAIYPRKQQDRYPVGGKITIGSTTSHSLRDAHEQGCVVLWGAGVLRHARLLVALPCRLTHSRQHPPCSTWYWEGFGCGMALEAPLVKSRSPLVYRSLLFAAAAFVGATVAATVALEDGPACPWTQAFQ